MPSTPCVIAVSTSAVCFGVWSCPSRLDDGDVAERLGLGLHLVHHVDEEREGQARHRRQDRQRLVRLRAAPNRRAQARTRRQASSLGETLHIVSSHALSGAGRLLAGADGRVNCRSHRMAIRKRRARANVRSHPHHRRARDRHAEEGIDDHAWQENPDADRRFQRGIRDLRVRAGDDGGRPSGRRGLPGQEGRRDPEDLAARFRGRQDLHREARPQLSAEEELFRR